MGSDFGGNHGTESAMHRSVEGDTAGRQPLTPSTEPVLGGETIAAISTPTGEGGIAAVRSSGATAVSAAQQIFRSRGKPQTFLSTSQHFGKIVDGNLVVYHAILSIHRAPRRYTGEDV